MHAREREKMAPTNLHFVVRNLLLNLLLQVGGSLAASSHDETLPSAVPSDTGQDQVESKHSVLEHVTRKGMCKGQADGPRAARQATMRELWKAFFLHEDRARFRVALATRSRCWTTFLAVTLARTWF